MAEVATKTNIRPNGTKQEARSDLSRQRILQAAVRIIQEGDLSRFNVRTICAEAGLTTGAFYHLFDSKEDVINYYLDYTFQQYKKSVAYLNGSQNASEKIRMLYQYMVESYTKAGPAFLSYFYMPTNPILNFRNRPNDAHLLLEEVDDFLTQGQREGFFREDIDHDLALLNIGSIVTGVMFYWCVFKGNVPAARLIDERLSEYLKTLEK